MPSPSLPIVTDTSSNAKWSGSPIVAVVTDEQAVSTQWATSRKPTDRACVRDQAEPVGPDRDRREGLALAALQERCRRRRAVEVFAMGDLQLVEGGVADQREPVGADRDRAVARSCESSSVVLVNPGRVRSGPGTPWAPRGPCRALRPLHALRSCGAGRGRAPSPVSPAARGILAALSDLAALALPAFAVAREDVAPVTSGVVTRATRQRREAHERDRTAQAASSFEETLALRGRSRGFASASRAASCSAAFFDGPRADAGLLAVDHRRAREHPVVRRARRRRARSTSPSARPRERLLELGLVVDVGRAARTRSGRRTRRRSRPRSSRSRTRGRALPSAASSSAASTFWFSARRSSSSSGTSSVCVGQLRSEPELARDDGAARSRDDVRPDLRELPSAKSGKRS